MPTQITFGVAGAGERTQAAYVEIEGVSFFGTIGQPLLDLFDLFGRYISMNFKVRWIFSIFTQRIFERLA